MMRPISWLLTARDGGRFLSFAEPGGGIFLPLYGPDQLAEAMAERDLLIRDLRTELNERRYGRSATK